MQKSAHQIAELNSGEKPKMFNVNMVHLKQPLKNRGLEYVKNNNGTVTINGKTFDRATDVESYLVAVDRIDIPLTNEGITKELNEIYDELDRKNEEERREQEHFQSCGGNAGYVNGQLVYV